MLNKELLQLVLCNDFVLLGNCLIHISGDLIEVMNESVSIFNGISYRKEYQLAYITR